MSNDSTKPPPPANLESLPPKKYDPTDRSVPYDVTGVPAFFKCTRLCGAACCQYITVRVTPSDHFDDEIRWWLAHQGVELFYDGEDWLLTVSTKCTNLKPDNTCGIYETRFDTCREYKVKNCEYDSRDVVHQIHLRTTADFDAWAAKRDAKAADEKAKKAARKRASKKKKAAAKR
jgi:Fe-S-cluster containining protein